MAGAASRDFAPGDPRGWRLGGGVTYASLALARLGVRVVALLGADEPARTARELDDLRAAGVDLRLQRLEHGPVFDIATDPGRRVIRCVSPSDPVAPDGLAELAEPVDALVLAPVADELRDGWLVPASGVPLVALGWQGLLRDLEPGRPVRRRPPRPGGLVARADLVVVSRDDLPSRPPLDGMLAMLRPGSTLVVTGGARGGRSATARTGAPPAWRAYPSLAPVAEVDDVGAGDVFLAAMVAARLRPASFGMAPGLESELAVAAAAASLRVERAGLEGVPDLGGVRERLARR